MKSPIVSTSWLEESLYDSQLILLDTSMRKVVGKKPIEYDEQLFIPRAKQFDLENVFCNLASSQNNAFPTQEQFTNEAQKLGINTDSTVVLYDNQGIYSSPRAWWIFQAMGFKNAVVLDGGLPQWILENRATVSELSNNDTEKGNISGEYQPRLVCDSHYIFTNMTHDKQAIVDARSTTRFLGLSEEPRSGIRSGHIPSSVNLPFAEILESHRFKTPQQLTDIFSTLLPDKSNEIIFTCGSGITACIIMLAATVAGLNNTILYDGSWSDWGGDESLPIEKN
jgi:thiosulfate/3-mercaptopyruvate sulfurtransferase